jgi:enoyl-CoA hydratase/carnithine racemase
MAYETVLYDIEDGIVRITINQAEKMNRLSNKVLHEVIQAVQNADQDDSVRVVIISGAGEKAFCAGADLTSIAHDSAFKSRENLNLYAGMCLALHRLRKPSIAKIRGLALAGGCGLAMLPTFSVASKSAKFGLPEINVGMWPMMVTATLFRTVGRKKGMELICLGEIIDAHEAEKMGMITKAVEDQELDDCVEKLAGKLRNKSGAIFKFGLEAYQTAMDMEYEKAMVFLRDSAAILTNSPDSMEGTKAFSEKRKPKWTT